MGCVRKIFLTGAKMAEKKENFIQEFLILEKNELCKENFPYRNKNRLKKGKNKTKVPSK